MTEPLDLAPIQARTNAATSGPWWNDTFEIYQGESGDTYRWIGETCNIDHPDASAANGDFIAHARQDVPALAAEVERLRAENDELTTELDGRDAEARERWIQNQENQLGIKYADFRAGRWEMSLAMGREMAAAYVAMAKALLGDAPNYAETKLEFDVKVAESPEMYTLVVQRHAPGALTPHEARQRAEAEAENLRVRLWLIEQHLASNESVFPLDLVPFVDGPLHPSDIDAYRAARTTKEH